MTVEDALVSENLELELFQDAQNWKRYWGGKVRPYLGQSILDVGAGLGANVMHLYEPGQNWTCIEPHEKTAAHFLENQKTGNIPSDCRLLHGTLMDLPQEQRFDSILYIDVLEHIQHDQKEVALAADRLNMGGHLIILVPAFMFLYSPFDKALGHYRRYSKSELLALRPQTLVTTKAGYLDSVGLLASLANKLMLKQSMPEKSQIVFWDRVLVNMSRVFDPLTFFQFGRSVLVVWRRI